MKSHINPLTAFQPVLDSIYRDGDSETVCVTYDVGPEMEIKSWSRERKDGRVEDVNANVHYATAETTLVHPGTYDAWISVDLTESSSDERPKASVTGYLSIEDARALRDELDAKISEHEEALDS